MRTHDSARGGRQTLVFLKTEDGGKIVHEHGPPSSNSTPGGMMRRFSP